MSEEINIPKGAKKDIYKEIIPQIVSVISAESNLIANLANISSILKMTFDHLWVGFYLVDGDTLVLGPFQGPLACTRIKKGKGVCGSAWEKQQTIRVENVNEFPGHIACSSESVSEIVVPLFDNKGKVFGVLDIDSRIEADFDEVDQLFLEDLSKQITNRL